MLLGIVAVMVSSCGRSPFRQSPVNRAIAVMDEAIEKIEQTDDPIELAGIVNQMQSDIQIIDAANKDYQPTEEELRQIRDKAAEVTRVYIKKTASSIPNVANSLPKALSDPSDIQEFTDELVDKLLPK